MNRGIYNPRPAVTTDCVIFGIRSDELSVLLIERGIESFKGFRAFPVVFELLSEVFTMPHLQNLYESILEVKLDRRNFSIKIFKSGVLTEVNDGTVRKGTRNPFKYWFSKGIYDQMKAKGFRMEL